MPELALISTRLFVMHYNGIQQENLIFKHSTIRDKSSNTRSHSPVVTTAFWKLPVWSVLPTRGFLCSSAIVSSLPLLLQRPDAASGFQL